MTMDPARGKPIGQIRRSLSPLWTCSKSHAQRDFKSPQAKQQPPPLSLFLCAHILWDAFIRYCKPINNFLSGRWMLSTWNHIHSQEAGILAIIITVNLTITGRFQSPPLASITTASFCVSKTLSQAPILFRCDDELVTHHYRQTIFTISFSSFHACLRCFHAVRIVVCMIPLRITFVYSCSYHLSTIL